MKIELYLPYYPENAVAGSGNDMSDEEYARRLMDMFGGGYNNFMDKAMMDSQDPRYNVSYVMPEKYMIESVEDNGKVEYYGFECVLNDENDANMSNDEFMFYANSGDMCAFFVHLVISDEYRNTDAINEINFWLKESREIMRDPHISDDRKITMLPYKDLIIKLPGVDSLVISGTYKLCGARVIEQDNNNNFAIIVTRIERSE